MPFLDKHLYVKKSTLPGAGKGLFTKVFIPKGTRITEYKGQVVTWKEVEKMADYRNGYVFYFSQKYCIDGWKTKKGVAHFANDAKGILRVPGIKNNSDYITEKRRCFIEAAKDIPARSEILVDYGREYWDAIRYNVRLEPGTKNGNKTDLKGKLPHHQVTKKRNR